MSPTGRARRSVAGDGEALARSDPLLRHVAPPGAEEEFARLFGIRAAGLSEKWGELSGWTLSRSLWKVADGCAAALRPYLSEVARGTAPRSLAALSRLPPELLGGRGDPSLADFRAALDGFLAGGRTALAWPDLWDPWFEGGGTADAYRLAGGS